MRLDVLYLLFVAYCVRVSDAGKKNVHFKFVIPKIIKHHHHTKIVFINKKDKEHDDHQHDDHGHVKGKGHEYGHDHGHDDHGKKQVVIHKHEHQHHHKHNHGHKHGHKHNHNHKSNHDHKHSHKHDSKHNHKHEHKHDSKNDDKKHDDYGFDKHHLSYGFEPYFYDDGGYHKSHKTLRSEHYQVETVKNPYSSEPQRHVVKSSYRVQENDPFDFATPGYHEHGLQQLKEGFDSHNSQFNNYSPNDKESEDYHYANQEIQNQNQDSEKEQEHFENYPDQFDNYGRPIAGSKSHSDYSHFSDVGDYTAAPEHGNLDLKDYKFGESEFDKFLNSYGDAADSSNKRVQRIPAVKLSDKH